MAEPQAPRATVAGTVAGRRRADDLEGRHKACRAAKSVGPPRLAMTVRLAAAGARSGRTAGASQQFERVELECRGERVELVEARIAPAALDPAEVGHVQLCGVGEGRLVDTRAARLLSAAFEPTKKKPAGARRAAKTKPAKVIEAQ
jgi:hypothetical protein